MLKQLNYGNPFCAGLRKKNQGKAVAGSKNAIGSLCPIYDANQYNKKVFFKKKVKMSNKWSHHKLKDI